MDDENDTMKDAPPPRRAGIKRKTAADLYPSREHRGKIYWDRKRFTTLQEHLEAIKEATTVYVGNMSFYTTEAQVYELFSTMGRGESCYLLRIVLAFHATT